MKTFGKVAFGLGLLLVLTSPLARLVTGEWTITLVKLSLGLVGIAMYFGTGNRPAAWAGSSGFYYLTSAVSAVVLLGILVVGNYVAVKRNKTWDLTAKKIYSLSPQTTQTLKDLKEPITALGFVPTTHPAYGALENLFKRYAQESDKFVYEFKDPRKAPDLAQKYQLREGQTTVVLTKGETHQSLNVISEQELTNALIKMGSVGQQKVYYLVGHGEWPLEGAAPAPGQEGSLTSASEFKSSLLQEGYAPEMLSLAEKNEIPKDAATLIVAGAKTKYVSGEIGLLEKYLEQGGRLIYFAEQGEETGLEPLLAKYGVQIDQGLLVDTRVNPSNPYVLISAFFGEHEITRILKQARMNVELPTVRGLSVLKEGILAGVSATPIVLTSPFAWEESSPSENPTLDSGEKAGAIPMVVASTRDTKAAADKRFDEARVVVFGDSQLVVDALWGHEGNRNLVLNSLAWASTQIQKITIRPPDRDISTLDIDDKLLAKIRFISMDALPVLLVGVGLSIWLTRRNK